jgi:hypothetical protein
MSWDLIVMDLPRGAAVVADIPADFKPASLGTRADVIAKIKQAVPTADFSDPSWGMIEGATWSIEISLGKKEACDSFALHVRGSGDEAVAVVAAIVDGVKLRAVDAQTGELFAAGPQGLESFRRWCAFRDRVIGQQ